MVETENHWTALPSSPDPRHTLSWPEELPSRLSGAGGPWSQPSQPEEFCWIRVGSMGWPPVGLPAEQPFAETLNLVLWHLHFNLKRKPDCRAEPNWLCFFIFFLAVEQILWGEGPHLVPFRHLCQNSEERTHNSEWRSPGPDLTWAERPPHSLMSCAEGEPAHKERWLLGTGLGAGGPSTAGGILSAPQPEHYCTPGSRDSAPRGPWAPRLGPRDGPAHPHLGAQSVALHTAASCRKHVRGPESPSIPLI